MSLTHVGPVAPSPYIRVQAVAVLLAPSPVQPAGSPQAAERAAAVASNTAVSRDRNGHGEKGRLVDVEA